MNELTEIVCILDRSGSMGGVIDDTIGGFNSFLNEQKNMEEKANLTLVLFDHSYKLLHNRVDIKYVSELTRSTYRIGGSTALNDAIGRTIHSLSLVPTSKVLFLIITDGYENASREFSTAQVKELVKDREEHFGWKFVFLGANIDSFLVGNTLGTQYNTNFVANSNGIKSLYSTISNVSSAYRSTGTISEDWDKDLNENKS